MFQIKINEYLCFQLVLRVNFVEFVSVFYDALFFYK